MTTFHFKAVSSDGKVRTGTLSGESDKDIARELRRQGLTPVFVGLEQKKGFDLQLPSFGGGKKKDILYFTEEMATLLNAGVPIDRAITISTELTERTEFRMIILDILRVQKGGRTLADSLATHPLYFSDLYINMVRAGEASGSLATVFTRLSEFEKTRDELRGYIISSLIYPALLATVGAGSIFLLLNFVVPRFAQVFEQSRMPIPTPTKIMLELSRVVQTYGPFTFGAIILATVFFLSYIRTGTGRMWWDTTRLQIPLLGDAMRKAETARFARAMGTLVSNSVPLVQSVQIAGATMLNKKISSALFSVEQGIKRGEGIAGPIKKCGQFPPLAAHLLSVGEETGRLDEMFSRMADIYENETRAAIKRFTTLFEPLILLIMGIMVGALVLSMLLAITSINEVAL